MFGLCAEAKGTMMEELLILTGSMISIGDMPADEVPQMAGVPHMLLELPGGQKVVVGGLTRDQCRACVPAFMSPARLTVSAT
jgi:hypothetical protein